jgi:serine/threonine protein kinase
MFDTKKTGVVDYEEFIVGLARVCRGSIDDRMRFIFEVHDLSGAGGISREELRTMLLHLPRPVLKTIAGQAQPGEDPAKAVGKSLDPKRPKPHRDGLDLRIRAAQHMASKHGIEPPSDMDSRLSPLPDTSDGEQQSDLDTPGSSHDSSDEGGASGWEGGPSPSVGSSTPMNMAPVGAPSLDATPTEVARIEAREKRDARVASRMVRSSEKWVDRLADRAFSECPVKRVSMGGGATPKVEPRLSFDEFKVWLHKTPEMMEFLQAVFPYSADTGGEGSMALPGEAGRVERLRTKPDGTAQPADEASASAARIAELKGIVRTLSAQRIVDEPPPVGTAGNPRIPGPSPLSRTAAVIPTVVAPLPRSPPLAPADPGDSAFWYNGNHSPPLSGKAPPHTPPQFHPDESMPHAASAPHAAGRNRSVQPQQPRSGTRMFSPATTAAALSGRQCLRCSQCRIATSFCALTALPFTKDAFAFYDVKASTWAIAPKLPGKDPPSGVLPSKIIRSRDQAMAPTVAAVAELVGRDLPSLAAMPEAVLGETLRRGTSVPSHRKRGDPLRSSERLAKHRQRRRNGSMSQSRPLGKTRLTAGAVAAFAAGDAKAAAALAAAGRELSTHDDTRRATEEPGNVFRTLELSEQDPAAPKSRMHRAGSWSVSNLGTVERSPAQSPPQTAASGGLLATTTGSDSTGFGAGALPLARIPSTHSQPLPKGSLVGGAPRSHARGALSEDDSSASEADDYPRAQESSLRHSSSSKVDGSGGAPSVGFLGGLGSLPDDLDGDIASDGGSILSGAASNATLAPPMEVLIEDQALPAAMAQYVDGDDLDALWAGREFADDDVDTTDTEGESSSSSESGEDSDAMQPDEGDEPPPHGRRRVGSSVSRQRTSPSRRSSRASDVGPSSPHSSAAAGKVLASESKDAFSETLHSLDDVLPPVDGDAGPRYPSFGRARGASDGAVPGFLEETVTAGAELPSTRKNKRLSVGSSNYGEIQLGNSTSLASEGFGSLDAFSVPPLDVADLSGVRQLSPDRVEESPGSSVVPSEAQAINGVLLSQLSMQDALSQLGYGPLTLHRRCPVCSAKRSASDWQPLSSAMTPVRAGLSWGAAPVPPSPSITGALGLPPSRSSGQPLPVFALTTRASPTPTPGESGRGGFSGMRREYGLSTSMGYDPVGPSSVLAQALSTRVPIPGLLTRDDEGLEPTERRLRWSEATEGKTSPRQPPRDAVTGLAIPGMPSVPRLTGAESHAAGAMSVRSFASLPQMRRIPLGAGSGRILAMHGDESAMVEHEGYLLKKGARTGIMTKRWYFLQQNFLYWYSKRERGPGDGKAAPGGRDGVSRAPHRHPKGVLFLEDSYVRLVHDESMASRGLFGFTIHTSSAHGDMTRTLFSKSQSERDEWYAALRRSCKAVPFDEVYTLGEELGRGRFSVVHVALHKETGRRYAVKVINKKALSESESELLRTEIAVLKLVQHPHIVRLENVYEDGKTMFIVMELLEGGELFNRIVGRARFSESEAKEVIKPLIESVAYLHSLGIVHRDIKPENILCGKRLQDLKIADFGLSKLVHPHEVMTMPCGTLSYVAPEVLSMQGYGRQADMWSVGVILYLVVRGQLPFDGTNKTEVIRATIEARIPWDHQCWKSWTSDGLEFVQALLHRDPKRRITARQALQHPWFTGRAKPSTRGRRHSKDQAPPAPKALAEAADLSAPASAAPPPPPPHAPKPTTTKKAEPSNS